MYGGVRCSIENEKGMEERKKNKMEKVYESQEAGAYLTVKERKDDKTHSTRLPSLIPAPQSLPFSSDPHVLHEPL